PVFHTIVSIKNDGHYFCRARGNRPDGLNEPVTYRLTPVDLEARNSAVAHRLTELTANFTIVFLLPSGHLNF
ncbi:hypothetical protein ACRWT8_26000, partial [Escherichia coli]